MSINLSTETLKVIDAITSREHMPGHYSSSSYDISFENQMMHHQNMFQPQVSELKLNYYKSQLSQVQQISIYRIYKD